MKEVVKGWVDEEEGDGMRCVCSSVGYGRYGMVWYE